jgi:hypothetical protein
LGVSTAKPGAKRSGNLQFSNLEVVSVQNRQGNFNNISICNGRVSQVLANVSGLLAVQCLENNGGHIRPPAGGLSFNITVEIPKHISSRDSIDPNGGITALLEVWSGHDPNFTVLSGDTENIAALFKLGTNTEILTFT